MRLLVTSDLHYNHGKSTELAEDLIRQIFYDYAYTRRTWQKDKSSRYGDVLAQRSFWEQPRVLGLGQRVGPFWYPAADNMAAGATAAQELEYGRYAGSQY